MSGVFMVGDRVELRYRGANEATRRGTVVGLHEKFFVVRFGQYQESFLWVDLWIGELRATVIRPAARPVAV